MEEHKLSYSLSKAIFKTILRMQNMGHINHKHKISVKYLIDFDHDFDPYLEMLDQNCNRTSIAHLDTQCLSSTFDEFHVMLNEY